MTSVIGYSVASIFHYDIKKLGVVDKLFHTMALHKPIISPVGFTKIK